MPLREGSSREAISANIRELMSTGRSRAVALAIALRKARGDRRKRDVIPLAPIFRSVEQSPEQIVDRGYTPPPGPGSARQHPGVENDPSAASTERAGYAPADPDPNTPPKLVGARTDARGRPRLPRQLPPTGHERDYAAALLKLIKRVRDAWAPALRMLPGAIASARSERGDARMDAGSDKIKRLIEHAAEHARRAVGRDEVESLARKFAERTSTYQRLQLARQVRAALGADPVFKDKGLAARTDQFAHENAALIVRIPQRLHGDVEAMVTRAVAQARPNEDLAADIEERFGVAERHARLIARDQISRFYGSLNHARQKELGVTRAVWRTVGDERVRPEHADMDGEEFEYDDPPIVDGEPLLPSEGIQCRCWSEPVLEDLDDDEDVDEDNDED